MLEILKFLVAPILVGLVSWLIKDYVFAQQKAKQEMLRAEWNKRLTTFWSPLFLWSGIILFPKYGEEKSVDKAVSALTAVLAENAHLLPRKYYYVIITLIEKVTVLPNKELDMAVVNETREYIYRQIETLNYLLYKRDNSFDPLKNTTFFGPPLALLRLVANASIHVLTWGLLAGFVYLGYYLLREGKIIWLMPYSLALLMPLWLDAERRIEMRNEAANHHVVRNRFGLLATLRWLRGRWLS